jgi:hypothetical protein
MYFESLNGDIHDEGRAHFNEKHFEQSSETHTTGIRIHPKKIEKATPIVPRAEIDSTMPEINLREWLNHTSKMLIFDWMPLTYFTFASMLAPRDHLGCYHYA